MSKSIRVPFDPDWLSPLLRGDVVFPVVDPAVREQRREAARAAGYLWPVDGCGLCRGCSDGGVCDG